MNLLSELYLKVTSTSFDWIAVKGWNWWQNFWPPWHLNSWILWHNRPYKGRNWKWMSKIVFTEGDKSITLWNCVLNARDFATPINAARLWFASIICLSTWIKISLTSEDPNSLQAITFSFKNNCTVIYLRFCFSVCFNVFSEFISFHNWYLF